MACGFAAASGDIIVMIDADGSTDPAEIPRFIGALISGKDFAKGSRFVQGGGSSDITRTRRLGNWGLNALVNVLFATKYTDLCYGYNAFWSDCLDVMDLPDPGIDRPQWGDGFEIESLINVRVAASGMQIAEVSSYELDRIHGASNLNAVKRRPADLVDHPAGVPAGASARVEARRSRAQPEPDRGRTISIRRRPAGSIPA